MEKGFTTVGASNTSMWWTLETYWISVSKKHIWKGVWKWGFRPEMATLLGKLECWGHVCDWKCPQNISDLAVCIIGGHPGWMQQLLMLEPLHHSVFYIYLHRFVSKLFKMVVFFQEHMLNCERDNSLFSDGVGLAFWYSKTAAPWFFLPMITMPAHWSSAGSCPKSPRRA